MSSLLKQPVMRACVDRYSEFCQALNMPTYPLTTATIALFLFAKCSHDNKDYTTNLRYLKRLQEASKTIWDECCEFDVEDTEVLRGGLKEFQAERVGVKSTSKLSSVLSLHLLCTHESHVIIYSVGCQTPRPTRFAKRRGGY